MAYSDEVSNFRIIDETKDKVLLHFNDHYAVASKPSRVFRFSPAIFLSLDAYCPEAPFSTKRARNLIARCYYVKSPRLEREIWHDDWGLEELKARTLREVTACEILKHISHPNIVSYHGCIITCGLIRGICYSLYDETLQERLNPNDKSKQDFRYQEAERPLRSRRRFFEGVEQGLLFLRSHGLVHNGISPRSLVISNEEPVIVNFQSCIRYGKSLKGLERPIGWHDLINQHSLYSNDLDALEELRRWLSDKGAKNYVFRSDVL